MLLYFTDSVTSLNLITDKNQEQISSTDIIKEWEKSFDIRLKILDKGKKKKMFKMFQNILIHFHI